MKKLLALLLLAACAEAASEPAAPVTPLAEQRQQQLLTAATPEADRGISAHEPVYFMFADNWRGDGNYGGKFQFSLKYRLFNPEEEKKPRSWERLYFAYSQTSLWDLEADSKPFRDSAYRPEIFWDRPDFSLFPSLQTLASLRAGVGHESNGKEGLDSRSINIAYVRPTFTYATERRDYVWSFAPKLYTYLDKSDNPDIADYRGYGDFLVKLKKDDTWECALTLRKGMKDNYGSTQLDVSYPFRGFLRNLNGYLYFQYFNGYGETILDYNVKQPSRIGLGLIVVR